MHEATIAQSILSIACEKLEQTPKADAVLNIHVIIGEFRNVDIDSLQFVFDNLKDLYKGCGACKLEAELISAKALCQVNSHRYKPDFKNQFCCTECGAGIGNLTCGEELDVVNITLQAAKEEASEYA